MSPEEKLILEIERAISGPKRTVFSSWELDFLQSMTQVFRRTNTPRSTRGLSPKQKGLVRTILAKTA